MMFYKIMRFNAAKLDGDKSASLDLARGRLIIISSAFAFLYILLAVRAFDLSIIQSDVFSNTEQHIVLHDTNNNAVVRRGRIYDRNGQMLADSLKMASLYADPKLISNPSETAQQIIQIFPELAYNKLLRDLQNNRRFVWLKRNINPAQQAKVLQIGEPGLSFQYEYRRVYPNKNNLAHVVGTTDVDGVGLSGIERSYDGMLAAGKDIELSIDARLQHILKREVKGAIDKFDALGGAGVIMNSKTGEVLAGVSLPDFDPHAMNAASSNEKFNRLTLGVYELGSVFKIFSTAAFLEHNDLPLSTSFDAREPLKVGRFTISDFHAEERILTIPEVFMVSSNIGSAMMGQAVGGEKLQQFYADLGLLNRMDTDILETGSPLTPNRWGEIATMTSSYGHGIATTPLHIAAAVSTVVNNGLQVKPSFIKALDSTVSYGRAQRIVSSETSYKMRQLLRLVVEEGTAKKVEIEGYQVGGKTGTAEKSVAGGYDSKRLISSFVSVFPVDDPQYTIYIAIDEPKGNKESFGFATAGWVAVPAVKNVIKSMIAVLGLEPTETMPQAHPYKQYIAVKG